MLSKRFTFGVWLVSKAIFWGLLLPKAAWGQVIPDGTTPTPNPGPCVPLCMVTGGITDPTGTNLFHSFDQFSVPDGGIVEINHPTNIRNIITRVTGGSESTINGTIRTDLTSETNLFLLNPSGILFGPNGSLEIGGSFAATTADAIQFGDQGSFSVNDSTSDLSLLTVDPSAFLFTQTTPKPITSQASAFNPTNRSLGLSVPANKSLLLVGGDIVLELSPTALFGASFITVPGGRIELGGVSSAGAVELDLDGDSLSLLYQNDTPLANVLVNDSILNVFNPFSRAGTVAINANALVMRDSILNSITLGSEDAGEITIQARDVVALNSSTIVSNTVGSGMGGSLTIVARSLSLNNSDLSVGTNVAAGDAGTIVLEAEITSLDEASNITSDAFGSPSQSAGNAGEITIQTNTLSLSSLSDISTSTNGEALDVEASGNLTINASERISLSGGSEITSETLGQRNAGNINVSTPLLEVDGSTISAAVNEAGSSGSDATGQGGSITFKAQLVSLENGAQITSSTSGEGEAGEILLQGETLTIDFQDNSEIAAATSSLGTGGQILVIAPEAVTLSGNGSLSTRSRGSGPAGDVFIQTNGQLRVQDGARVEVSGEGTGDSGTLGVIAGTAVLNDGQLLASTQAGEGGNISLQIDDALVLREDSLISARAFTDADGGNVDISTPFIIALFPETGSNGNDVQASAEDGDGGRITIQANTLFNIAENIAIDGNMTNDLDASSGTGIDGIVIIETLEVDPDEGTVRLPSGLADPEISQGCQAGGDINGQFVNAGRGGLSRNPYESLSGDGIQEDIFPAGQIAAQQPALETLPETIVEAQGWGKNAQGDIVLVTENPADHSTCQRTFAGAS